MTGDPKVLAGLQQAYLAATNAKVLQRIQIVWDFETIGKIVNSDADADREIRAWTPPPAEPSLDERLDIYGRDINELAATANDHMLELAELKASIERLKNQQTLDCKHTGIALTDLDRRLTVQEHKKPEQHPEPTAPDDPECEVPGCPHCWAGNGSRVAGCPYCSIPAPQPAPDLDPVRVEAAAKAAWNSRGIPTPWAKVTGELRIDWIRDAEIAIRHYLKDGGA